MTRKPPKKRSIFEGNLGKFKKLEWDIIEPLFIGKGTDLYDLGIVEGDIVIIIRKKNVQKAINNMWKKKKLKKEV